MNQHPLKILFTEIEAAQYLSMSRAFLRQDRMNSTLEGRTPGPTFYQIGRTIRYAKKDLDAWLKQFRVEREI